MLVAAKEFPQEEIARHRGDARKQGGRTDREEEDWIVPAGLDPENALVGQTGGRKGFARN